MDRTLDHVSVNWSRSDPLKRLIRVDAQRHMRFHFPHPIEDRTQKFGPLL